MNAPYVLVLILLTVESSYKDDIERPAVEASDTIQFWFSPVNDWRIKTFAIDHDIHTHVVRSEGLDRTFGPEQGIASTRKSYGDVIAKVVQLEFSDPRDSDDVARILRAHELSGTLEIGRSGVAFYNPDRARYRTQSEPK